MMVRMKKRITISIDPEVLASVQEEVEAGEAPNISAAIEALLRKRKQMQALKELLQMFEEHHAGNPLTEEEKRQAREDLRVPGSTRGD